MVYPKTQMCINIDKNRQFLNSCFSANVESFQEFIDNNINVNVTNHDNENGLFFIHFLNEKNKAARLYISETLLAKKIKKDHKNNRGNTALMCAVIKGNHLAVDFLLANNVDKFKVNKNNLTAMDLALNIKNVYVLKTLLKYYNLEEINNFQEQYQAFFKNVHHMQLKEELIKFINLKHLELI